MSLRTEPPMMACGHAANATARRVAGVDYDPPIPSCVICDCFEVAKTAPDLTGRKAKCSYRNGRGGREHDEGRTVASSPSLAFFEHQPDQPFDRYYCGCWGWD